MDRSTKFCVASSLKGKTMTIKVPATSANMGPGFDTLGISLQLFNEVTITESKFHSISIRGESSKNIKLKSNSMFVDIFNKHYETICDDQRNFRFQFTNDIPLGRGLGSSSAVITSAIASAYKVANIPITKKELLNLSLKLEKHPDNIAPAVFGGFVVSIVKDEKVISIKKNMPDEVTAVVVIPNKPISTKQSRKKLPKSYTKEESIFNLSRSSLLTGAIFSENWSLLREASKDMFHEEYRIQLMPSLIDVQNTALNNGALMSTLSGSGSTIFSICYKNDAKNLESKLKHSFPKFRVRQLKFDNQGIKSN